MRIALVTDAWRPQINGVVTALTRTVAELEAMGHEVRTITPQDFATWGLPSYREIQLAVLPGRGVRRRLDDFQPEAIHIATEGPLGFAARRYCRRRGLRFTTSFQTRFPEYVHKRLPFVPVSAGYALVRWFHSGAARTLVTTSGLRDDLAGWGLKNLALWSRGVDTEHFYPRDKGFLQHPRPIFLYAGRVAREKSLEDFLGLDLPGTKVVVGDGPARPDLEARYPEAVFAGFQVGEALAQYLAAADVFVFPSRTDTLGLVLLEAMASGVPVATYPVAGPIYVVREGVTGVMRDDLGEAAMAALALDGDDCRAYAQGQSWQRSAEEFFGHLVPAAPQARAVAEV